MKKALSFISDYTIVVASLIGILFAPVALYLKSNEIILEFENFKKNTGFVSKCEFYGKTRGLFGSQGHSYLTIKSNNSNYIAAIKGNTCSNNVINRPIEFKINGSNKLVTVKENHAEQASTMTNWNMLLAPISILLGFRFAWLTIMYVVIDIREAKHRKSLQGVFPEKSADILAEEIYEEIYDKTSPEIADNIERISKLWFTDTEENPGFFQKLVSPNERSKFRRFAYPGIRLYEKLADRKVHNIPNKEKIMQFGKSHGHSRTALYIHEWVNNQESL